MDVLEQFKRQFTLVRILGVPVRADMRWFIVFAVLSAITAASVAERVENFWASLGLGFATTLVFFASIFLHEFAHALAAKMEDLETIEIVLHPFGGLTRFRHEPETPRAEFRIAVAGPAMSFLLTLLFVGLMAAAGAGGLDILAILLFLLALSNFLLAVFNMFPGYPLDGGRVLRAYLWRSGRDLNEATILTGRAGQVIAVGLGVLGLFILIFRGEIFTGFWAMLVGYFLYDSAKGIIAEVHAAEHMTVDQVMYVPAAVTPDTNIQHFVDHILPVHRRSVFAVAADKQLYGMLLLEDLKALDRDRWRETPVAEAMRAVTTDQFVETGTRLSAARAQMRTNNIGAVGVIDKTGNLVGLVYSGRLRRK